MKIVHLRGVRAVAGIFLWGLTATAAIAMPVTVSPLLTSGDQYRLAFVTTGTIAPGTVAPDSSDITLYNDFVTADAHAQTALAALGTTWTAIASATRVNARDNTGTVPTVNGGSNGVPIYLLDGSRLVSGYDSFWNHFGLLINFDRDGNEVDFGTRIWTGSRFTGVGDLAFGLTQTSVYGTVGGVLDDWIREGDADVSDEYSLYGISGILTVPTVTAAPEPGALGILALGFAGIVLARRRRQDER